jgi:hypothetical protein
MIRAGDSLVNPVTGERLVFELTSYDRCWHRLVPGTDHLGTAEHDE